MADKPVELLVADAAGWRAWLEAHVHERNWSVRNAGRAERLFREGRMHRAGVAEIERARADGRWPGV